MLRFFFFNYKIKFYQSGLRYIFFFLFCFFFLFLLISGTVYSLPKSEHKQKFNFALKKPLSIIQSVHWILWFLFSLFWWGYFYLKGLYLSGHFSVYAFLIYHPGVLIENPFWIAIRPCFFFFLWLLFGTDFVLCTNYVYSLLAVWPPLSDCTANSKEGAKTLWQRLLNESNGCYALC